MAEIARANDDQQQCMTVALFEDGDMAQDAIEQLKNIGIPETQIGVASSEKNDHEQKGFWERARTLLGARDETSTGSEFQQSLTSQGLSDAQSRYFNSQLRDGGVLVTVHSDREKEPEVIRLLRQSKADLGAEATETASTQIEERMEGTERRIQVLGERLRVTKERISSGEVTIRKEIVTEPQRIEVPVTREEVVIERHQATGEAPAGAVGADQDKTIRIPVTEERINVEKVPVVREEVTVQTRPVEETKQVADETRREQLRVEKEGAANVDEVPPERRKAA